MTQEDINSFIIEEIKEIKKAINELNMSNVFTEEWLTPQTDIEEYMRNIIKEKQ